MALERLFELGHRRIALLAGGSMRGGSSWRFDTIKEFYSKKNMYFPEGLNIHCDMNESSLASFSKARSSVRNCGVRAPVACMGGAGKRLVAFANSLWQRSDHQAGVFVAAS